MSHIRIGPSGRTGPSLRALFSFFDKVRDPVALFDDLVSRLKPKSIKRADRPAKALAVLAELSEHPGLVRDVLLALIPAAREGAHLLLNRLEADDKIHGILRGLARSAKSDTARKTARKLMVRHDAEAAAILPAGDDMTTKDKVALLMGHDRRKILEWIKRSTYLARRVDAEAPSVRKMVRALLDAPEREMQIYASLIVSNLPREPTVHLRRAQELLWQAAKDPVITPRLRREALASLRPDILPPSAIALAMKRLKTKVQKRRAP